MSTGAALWTETSVGKSTLAAHPTVVLAFLKPWMKVAAEITEPELAPRNRLGEGRFTHRGDNRGIVFFP